MKNIKPPQQLPDGSNSLGIPIRILVVDDETIMRKIVSRIIKSVGYEVAAEADNGFNAVEAYKLHKPDMVIMDVKMPRLDGLEALKEIIKFDKDAVIIMLTAERDTKTVKQILEAGAKNYIVKPVDRSALLNRLGTLKETIKVLPG